MAKRPSKSYPVWSHVKAKLVTFDQRGLMDVIHDLYAANKDNQAFLHTRFELGDDVLEPYKLTISRWLWPDVIRNQDVSVAKARQAISSYSKAVNNPAGLAELTVFYCEQAIGFSNDVGYSDESYLDAFVRMFKQALVAVSEVPAARQAAFLERLNQLRAISHIGYGVGDEIDYLFEKSVERRS